MTDPAPIRRAVRRLLALGLATLPGNALAVSIGDMADEATENLARLPATIAIALYIIGPVIATFGLLRLKRHVDHPQQASFGAGLTAILIGVAITAAPPVINAVIEAFGLNTGLQNLTKPRL